MTGDSVKGIFMQGREIKEIPRGVKRGEMNQRQCLVLLSVFTSRWKDMAKRFKGKDVKIKETLSLVPNYLTD